MTRVLCLRRRVEYIVFCLLWLWALVYFWQWWLRPENVLTLPDFAVVTLTLAWITLLPTYFLVVFYGARKPSGPVNLPAGTRVAMVVTKAPSEPFAIVARTLKAMLAQDYRHDTWLADEDPSAATLAWCRENGVKVSTRRGRADYHLKTWPRRTRCKEGNLAFFYDHFGYDNYDFVAQLDADHEPEPGYLREMIRPFADPSVGYVSAPSICDRNAAESWSARGRLYIEANKHGSLQAGFNNGWAPLCIGSHYAVRTKALKEIGGLGPELAEDHSTTMIMNAHGWRGVHALDAIAHGDGPSTFADLATQEFQWARSLMMILLQYSPTYAPMLQPKLRFQFLFSQLWYPLSSVFMAMMYALPIVALLTGEPFVAARYPDFLAHFLPLPLVLLPMAFSWRASGSYRPGNARILGWEGMIYLFACWPWTLAGCVAALHDRLTGTVVDFRVTPKGANDVGHLPVRILVPYAALSIISALPALLVADAGAANGFYIFAIVNALIYAIVLAVIVGMHDSENAISGTSQIRGAAVGSLLAALFLAPVGAGATNGTKGLMAVSWGAESFQLTRVLYAASGAGQKVGNRKVVFSPRWLGTRRLEAGLSGQSSGDASKEFNS